MAGRNTASSPVFGVQELSGYLTFTLCGDRYGIEVMRIKEIIEYDGMTPVRTLPRFVRGVCNLRGRGLPVVDLARRLGIGETEIGRRTCVVIVEAQPEGAKRFYAGILVDAVNEVLDLGADALEPAPSLGGQLNSEFLRGLAKTKDGFVTLLDVNHLLSLTSLTEEETPAAHVETLAEQPQPPVHAQATAEQPPEAPAATMPSPEAVPVQAEMPAESGEQPELPRHELPPDEECMGDATAQDPRGVLEEALLQEPAADADFPAENVLPVIDAQPAAEDALPDTDAQLAAEDALPADEAAALDGSVEHEGLGRKRRSRKQRQKSEEY